MLVTKGVEGDLDNASPGPPSLSADSQASPTTRRSRRRFDVPAPGSLLPDLTAGLVLGALTVTISISLTALMLGPELQPYMARTIGLVLSGGVLLGLVVTLLTSVKGMVAHIQDAPAAVLAALVATLVSGMPGAASEERWLTSVALMILATLAAGLLYFLVGVFRLGGLIRYLPYPVLGGFMAGTGWLLLTGGIGIMSGVNLHSLGELSGLFAAGAVARWLPGVGLAVALLVLTRRIKHFLVWPATLLAAIAVFYLVMGLGGWDPDAWRRQGLLLGPFPQGSLFDPLGGAELGAIRWQEVASQLPGVLTVAFVCLFALLLNSTGLEQAIGRKVDLNRELRAAGLGNLLGGAVGGAPSYHGLSFTVFNYTAGSGGRLASLFSAAVMTLTLFFGAGAIQVLPTVILGALVAFLGFGFLHDWLVAAVARLPLAEYLIMLAIFVAIVTLGVLAGVGVGLVLAVTMFVFSSSRTEAVRYASDLGCLRSRVSRPQTERRLLNQHGRETLIFKLQGFLFFGTATSLAERLERIGADTPPRHVVLDFERVTGVDSSGIATIGGLARRAADGGFELCLSAVGGQLKSRIMAASGSAPPTATRFFENLDAALEHCEQRTLERHDEERAESIEPVVVSSVGDGLEAFRAAGLDLASFAAYLQPRRLATGEVLIHQGAAADALYFLVDGQMTASLSTGHERLRLEAMRTGSLLGELAFYRGQPRSANVAADVESEVLVLTSEGLERMHREEPQLAAALHRQVARLMAGRVEHLMTAVEALRH